MPPITQPEIIPTTPSTPAQPEPKRWKCVAYMKSNGDEPSSHSYRNVKVQFIFDDESKMNDWIASVDPLIAQGKKVWFNTARDCWEI